MPCAQSITHHVHRNWQSSSHPPAWPECINGTAFMVGKRKSLRKSLLLSVCTGTSC